MDRKTYEAFSAAREDFRSAVSRWMRENPGLGEAQERLRRARGYGDYCVETPIVYNAALDRVGPDSKLRGILVADNPGKNEQLAANRSYLVGQSGKLALSFYRNSLGIDFRTEVLVLNKTPVHTPKTAELKLLAEYADLVEESQRFMARLSFRLHSLLRCPLWIVGYSELDGLFAPFAGELAAAYRTAPPDLKASVLVFRHFSMNQFAIDLKRNSDPALGVEENLERLGTAHRARRLGF
jgi:hypothetical protein